MKKFTVTTPARLRDFTDAVYPQGSFYFSALLRAGDIRVNGVKTRSDMPLKGGDEVVYYTTPKMESKPSHSTIYAGQHIYVADKFSGVSTEALACELGMTAVHRLDRNTCGAIVFAKDEDAAEQLKALFKERAVRKEYICICKDNFASPSGDLRAYLIKDEKKGLVTITDSPSKGGVPIRTEYEVEERQGGLAKVKVILHTGKTHQIRAHMAHIGCPVLGDEKYGDEALNAKYGVRRQLLCSALLAFDLDGRSFAFHSSLIPDFPQPRSQNGCKFS